MVFLCVSLCCFSPQCFIRLDVPLVHVSTVFLPSSVSASFFLLFSFISCLLFGSLCALKNVTECGNKAASQSVSPVEKDACCPAYLALCIQFSFFFALSVFSLSISTLGVFGCHDPDFFLSAVRERKQSLKRGPGQRGVTSTNKINEERKTAINKQTEWKERG